MSTVVHGGHINLTVIVTVDMVFVFRYVGEPVSTSGACHSGRCNHRHGLYAGRLTGVNLGASLLQNKDAVAVGGHLEGRSH